MSLTRKQLYIGSMTCVNCQNKIARKLRSTAGIVNAAVSYSKGTAEITYDKDLISLKDIIALIEDLGYEVISRRQANQTDLSRAASLTVIIVSLYVILQESGILNLLIPSRLADTGMGYGMLFVVGAITSVHCIAMCGGINLTQCIPHTADGNGEKSGGASVFRSAFLYNLGRVVSYTLIGFILGLGGMVIGGGGGAGIPAVLQGILKMAAGIIMVIMGINMLGIFPWLRKVNIRLPEFAAARIQKQKSKSRLPFVVGLLNGLMPCGPLQSMQIVALASADPFAGALSMFMFSLGTVPLMMGLGSIVSALGQKFARKVMGVGAVLVAVLGLAMLSQGGSLSGMLLPDRMLILIIVMGIFGIIASIPFNKAASRAAALTASAVFMVSGGIMWNCAAKANVSEKAEDTAGKAEIRDGVQTVSSVLEPGSYPDITVQAGIPVKWEIDAPQGSINGCNYKMILEEYGIEYSFSEGENIIEFTPTETGTYGYTCWMGMIHGSVYVTEEDGTAAPETEKAAGGETEYVNDGYDEEIADYGAYASGGSCCGETSGYGAYPSGGSCCGDAPEYGIYTAGGSCCGW